VVVGFAQMPDQFIFTTKRTALMQEQVITNLYQAEFEQPVLRDRIHSVSSTINGQSVTLETPVLFIDSNARQALITVLEKYFPNGFRPYSKIDRHRAISSAIGLQAI
jgi:hypothetical protein